MILSRLAAVVWIVGAVQFFVAQIVVGAAWERPYSWAHHNISDLGNVTCGFGPDDGRYICSPLHPLMNTAIVVGGLCIITGALLSRGRPVARALLVPTGGAWMLVGLVPADVDENIHVLGAVVIFVIGNVALLLLGRQSAAALFGAIGFVAAFLHLSGTYLGLGMGGMERVTAFTVPIWILVVGMLAIRTRSSDKTADRNLGTAA